MSGQGLVAPDLPVEILSEIFQLAYPDHAERFRWKDPMYWDEDLANPTITPNSLSSVCRMWDVVLGGIPDFWTHIVVHIDDFRHFHHLQLALERSRPRDVKSITILHSTQSGDIDEGVEREGMEHIFARLGPEDQARIRSLAVRTRWSGSLPNTMIRPWTELCTLKLESERRGLHQIPAPTAVPMANPSISFPLSVLGVTGPMFVNLWRSVCGREVMKNASLLSLTVCCLRAEDGGREKPFTIHELARAVFSFCSVRNTNLVDIDFPTVTTVSSVVGGEALNGLRFKEVPIRLIIHFIDNAWRPSQHTEIGTFKIHRCHELSKSERAAIQGNRARSIKALYLELTGVSNPSDILLLWSRINAKEIHIRQCHGFTDKVLTPMAAYSATLINQSPLLQRVEKIEIVNCHNYSSDRLRTLLGSKYGVTVCVAGDTTTVTWKWRSH